MSKSLVRNILLAVLLLPIALSSTIGYGVVQAKGIGGTVMRVQVSSSSNTDAIELEITGSDESNLARGEYILYARVKGAHRVELRLDGELVDAQTVVNNGEWQDVIFRLRLDDTKEHQITITAVNQDDSTFAESMLKVELSSDDDALAGGLLPLAPNTGSYMTIGGVQIKTTYIWIGVPVCISLLIIWAANRRKKRAGGI